MPHLNLLFMFTVYAIFSPDFGKIYIGYSANLPERLKAHNSNSNTGWTAKFKPWTVVYVEEMASKSDALRREKQLKSAKGREFVWNIINGNFM